jgi:rfaE bifunctional protein kinase chain/domain
MKHKHHRRTKDRLRRIVEEFPRLTITVLGDLVADEFVYGEISRVSREAPVLILKQRESIILPGAAGNAVYNLADLGVTVLPVGVVGDDTAGRELLHRFRQKHIALNGILRMKGHATVTKTRILAGMAHTSRQQVVRLDREPEDGPGRHAQRELVLAARQYARAADAMLVSDYGYGTATPDIVDQVRARGAYGGIPITLDSRFRMLEFTGVTAATPNEAEVEEALSLRIGDDPETLEEAGRALLRRMRLQSLLITRGRDGMMAFERARKPLNIPIYGSDQIADVTGAGDTVIAVFTAALAAGGDTESAARLANYAGGIVVMKRGTATVSRAELLAAVESA